MSATALFLCGPLDGELRAVQNPFDYISAYQPVSLPAWEEAASDEPIVPKTVLYQSVKLRAFGRNFLAFAPVNATERERNEAACRHFLSDKGRGCVA